jgi:hypothetical protein
VLFFRSSCCTKATDSARGGSNTGLQNRTRCQPMRIFDLGQNDPQLQIAA